MGMLIRQAWFETKLLFRGLDNVFWTLAFPLLFIVLFGFLYGDLVWFEDTGVRAIDYILPGILVMAIMVTGIMQTAIGFAEERERGIYRRLSITPLKPSAILGGQILHRYVLVLVQTLIIFAVGMLAFGVRIAGSVFWTWVIITFGALCFLALGFFLAGLIKSAKAANAITMVVFFMFLFLGGVFFPGEMMPEFLATLSGFLPSTLLNDGLREVTILGHGIGSAWQQLLGIGIWFIVALLGSIKLFRWE